MCHRLEIEATSTSELLGRTRDCCANKFLCGLDSMLIIDVASDPPFRLYMVRTRNRRPIVVECPLVYRDGIAQDIATE